MSEPGGSDRNLGLVRAPQSLVSGLGMIALGIFGVWAASDLPQGTLSEIGPGLLPHWLSIGVACCGLALLVAGFLRDGEKLELIALRAPAIVLLSIFAFALTIRPFSLGSLSTPGLGLIVAGPLAVIVGGYASREARFLDLVILALLLTAGCMLLFGDLLNLPIPIFPNALIEALSGKVSSKAMLRMAAGALALIGLILLFVRRRTTSDARISVATHSTSS